MKKRVVVTGIGICSNIGSSKIDVLHSLKTGKSGIKFDEEFKERKLLSLVSGKAPLDAAIVSQKIHRKYRRFMAEGSIYAALSTLSALEDAGIDKQAIANKPNVGSICGAGGTPTKFIHDQAHALNTEGFKSLSAFGVPKMMSSSVSANICTMFEINGIGLSVSAACASSTHAIGLGFQAIQDNRQDIIIAVGADELQYTFASPFDAMGALSRKYNDTPEIASRPYDLNRDGFVIASGSGTLILESVDHAMARGAKIYAEIIGYGSTSDGKNMVQPNATGASRCMKKALDGIDSASIDYINAHGTSTPVGDLSELEAIEQTFGQNIPDISSTKSMTGHSLGACGAQEAIYTLLMMENNFIAPSINIENIDPKAKDFPIIQKTTQKQLNMAMTNNFGFGGNNAALVFKKCSPS